MRLVDKNAIHRGNSVISVETLPGYPDPVVVKKPSSQPPSQQVISSLEREYVMTRALDGVEGVRKALGQEAIEGQPALILEYVEGETLREAMEDETLDLGAKLGIAVELARVLGTIHGKDIIHLDLESGNILISPDRQSVHIIDLGSAVHVDRSGYQKVGPSG